MVSLSWIELEGASNVRDLGGLAASGGRTRPGVLLRADALDRLTEGDVAELVERRRLAQVVDLRTAGERAERGRGRLGATGVRYAELEVITDEDLVRRAVLRSRRLDEGAAPAEVMAEGYVELLEVGSAAFVAAFSAVAAPDGVPALVHCSAGKDRTGVLVALLLDAAGVEREVIVADYAATQERMDRIVAGLAGAQHFQDIAAHVPVFVLGAPSETMVALLAALDEGWGGAAGWFTAHGVPEHALATWRDLLVDPAS